MSNDAQLQGLRRVGQLVAQIWVAMQAHAKPGMRTDELDALAAELLQRAGAESAPQLCYGFPGHTCISINEQAAHGIPSARLLNRGDVINIDVSARLDGYFADTGGSFVLEPGATAQLGQRLCAAAMNARDAGVAQATTGQRLNRIGQVIERSIHASGFRNVRNLCGHGVGAALHEEPTVRNYYDVRDAHTLVEGQVLTIEPFLSTNVSRVHEQADGWTLAGRPSSLFAQFEHTLVVRRGAPIILTLP